MRKDLILVAIIVATLMLMVVPLSQDFIDFLLAVNITLSVLLLMVAVYLKHPSDFSTFPSVILIGTAFRLALSVGTTRLILSEADAGQIIETFGDFVVSGSVAIGLVIFLIITVVQFLVVTKGAERVAEVGARFALDALPGKQLSIDAEMRAGNIDQDEATRLRKRLDRDSQFFGAMDGAMKFVKGDAIAGMIIICINLLGGIAVGISVHGYSFGEAVGVFSLLTVGDGLVAQIPALLMSLCAGVIVTRVANQDNDDLGSDIFKELVADPRVPTVAAAIVLAIGVIPGFPFTIFLTLSAILMLAALLLRRTIYRARAAEAEANEAEAQAAGAPTEEASQPVSDRLWVRLEASLTKDIDLKVLEKRLLELFASLYAARGVRFPRAGIVVSEGILEPREMVVELDEVPIFKEVLREDSLVVPGGAELSPLFADSAESKDARITWPGLNAYWLPVAQQAKLDALGLKELELTEVVARVVFRLYEHNLGTLFTNAIANAFLDEARAMEPETMAMVDNDSTPPALYRMLRYLVEDGVPLRPIPLLVSSIHYWIHTAETPTALVLAECLRGSMKRQLCHRITGGAPMLGIALLDPSLEALARQGMGGARQSMTSSAANDGLTFTPEVTDALLTQFRSILAPQQDGARHVAIVASADIRRRLRNFLAANNLHLSVLAPHEIANEIPTYPVELIRAPGVAAGDARPGLRDATKKPVRRAPSRAARQAGTRKEATA